MGPAHLLRGNDNPTVVKFSGSRDAANAAAARQRIDNWIKRQQQQKGAR